jgi:Domain of unknown function (DUF4396)
MKSLYIVSEISLFIAGLCALIIAVDIVSGNRQKMMIMNFVFPITGLYAGPLALLFYYSIGKKSSEKNMRKRVDSNVQYEKKPFWQSVVIGSLHCGSGCTLGDVTAEIFLLFIPVSLFGSTLAGKWFVDYVFAFTIGIIFQYYSIKPMKNLSPKEGLKAALKADTLSLTAWQTGMYGWMAIAIFLIFHHKMDATDPVFWFMMQIAMLLGFITSFPMNWFLIKKGIKEKM